ncbi:MAG: hypothetical protein V3V20_00780 [Algisphaera sp.]
MTVTATPLAQRRLVDMPKTFAGLNRLFSLRPIHNKAGLDAAMAVGDVMAGHDLNPDQADYFESLCTLIESYERENDLGLNKASVTPVEMLRYLCQEANMKGAELGKLLGQSSIGSKLLRGEREMSKAHIRTLCDHFHVSAELLL